MRQRNTPMPPDAQVRLSRYPSGHVRGLESEWSRLAVSTSQVDPFCCAPAWQLSFHQVFSPSGPLLVESAQGSLVAFAHMVNTRGEAYLTPLEPYWCFGCPVLGRHGVDLLCESLAALERADASALPAVVVSGVRPGGVLLRRLRKRLGDGFDFSLVHGGVQCSASLDGGLDGYLSRRSGTHRRNIRRASRRAREQGVSFERVAPRRPEEVDTAFMRILRVELASWKGKGRCGMAESPVREFYYVLLQRLAAAGDARILFARHGGVDIGFVFGGMAGRTYRGQQFSFDDRWRKLSIGNLMQVEQLGWLCEEGARRYDMGPLDDPRMAYKAHWTEKRAVIQTWMLRRLSPVRAHGV